MSSSPPPRPTWRSSPDPPASRAAAFWPCWSAPGSSLRAGAGSPCISPAPWSAMSTDPVDAAVEPGRRSDRVYEDVPPGVQELSAGGVVVDGGRVVVIVPVKRATNGRRVLGLPKGHPDRGETLEQAARREVREEAGVEGELLEGLGVVRYQYERRGRRIDKAVR